jgi:hypothetical protein
VRSDATRSLNLKADDDALQPSATRAAYGGFGSRAWCTLCLLSAAISRTLVPPAVAEEVEAWRWHRATRGTR